MLPDLEVTALDHRGDTTLAAVPGQGVWRHGGGPPHEWRQVWEGDPRCVRVGPNGTLHVGSAPVALLRSRDDGASWQPSQTLQSVIRYQRTRSSTTGARRWALDALALPADALLVGIGGAGVWLSNDDGRNWMPRSEGIDLAFTALWEHPERRDRVYAVTASGLYRSDDGGFSWLQSLTGLDRSAAAGVAVLPGAPDALVLSAARRPSGEHGALFRSIDGGVRWTRLSLGEDDGWERAPLVTPLAGSPDTVFALAAGAVWASHDRGADWRRLTDPGDAARLPPARCLAVAL